MNFDKAQPFQRIKPSKPGMTDPIIFRSFNKFRKKLPDFIVRFNQVIFSLLFTDAGYNGGDIGWRLDF